MITEDYVSFETAKLLKEKGFDETCRAFWKEWNGEISLCGCNSSHTFEYCHNTMLENYNDSEETNIAAPTLQMAIKWLREVHNIDVVIDAAVGMLGVKVYIPLISTYKPLKDSPSKVRQIKRGIYYKDDKGIISALQHFDSCEEACEAAIKYCLENLI